MREIIAYNIYQWDSLIEGWIDETAKKPAGTLLTKKEAKTIHGLLIGIISNTCEEIGWDEAERRVNDLENILNFKSIKKLPSPES